MIKEVDDTLLESLKKGLQEFSPIIDLRDSCSECDKNKDKSVFVVNTGFVVEDIGMGSSEDTKKEEFTVNFKGDGKKRNFKLSQKPLDSSIIVENPKGIIKRESDDYTFNLAGCVIVFRIPPKGDIQIKYSTDNSVAIAKNLKFILTYNFQICSKAITERDAMALEIVKLYYKERENLSNIGIDIQFIKGYPQDMKMILEYQIEKIIQLVEPQPSIGKVKIGQDIE